EGEKDLDLRDRITLLETYLDDRFFGDWWHNVAAIVLTGFFAWFAGYIGGGITWLAVILAFTATYYRTSILRLRRNVRDDVIREMAMRKLETDTETMEWLNSFLVKFWLIYEPVLSTTVVGTTNQVLAGNTPSFIDSMFLDTFTLGTKSPRIDSVRTFPKTEDDVVVMDWKFSFLPNDTEDLTTKQLSTKVNPKVVFKIRIGKAMVAKNLPILLEDMSFQGHIRVRIKLMSTFPHVKTVDISFLEPPYFDYVLKPIGGETFGFDINVLPGLDSFIKDMVHSNLGPMMYAPHFFQLNVEEMLSGEGDSSVGVMALTLYGAKGLRGSPDMDPYCRLGFTEVEELTRSSIKKNTCNPVWNETKYLLVRNLGETLYIKVFDYNSHRKDQLLGAASFPLEVFESEPAVENKFVPLIKNAKSTGELNYGAFFFPVEKGRELEDGSIEPPPNLNTGIMKFTVHQVKDLDPTVEGVKAFSPYAQILINGKPVYATKRVKHSNSPIWDEGYECIVRDRRSMKLGVKVFDYRSGKDPVIASYHTKLDTLINHIQQREIEWFSMRPFGRVRLGVTFKPVHIKGIESDTGYFAPIGVMRFEFIKATDLRNIETIGKVDPYVRVMMNSFMRGRTFTLDDETEPVWHDYVYAAVYTLGERCTIEVMDSERSGKDRSLGSFAFDITPYVRKKSDGEYDTVIDETIHEGRLVMNKRSPKGILEYRASFFPIYRVKTPEERAKELEAEKEAEAEQQSKPEKSKESVRTDDNNADEDEEDGDDGTVDDDEAPVHDLSFDEIIKYKSGVLIFTIKNAVLARPHTYIEVLVDDHSYPSYSTSRAETRKFEFNETNDAIIRELEYSQTIIRMSEKQYSADWDDAIASATIPTLTLLKSSYEKPTTVSLTSQSGEISKVNIQCRFQPLLIKLDPSESIMNMGNMRIDILDASNLPAADMSGKSDPYTLVKLNNVQLFKSKVIKKTLNPVWNEYFEFPVRNRIYDQLELEVMDWDISVGDDDFLGHAILDMGQVEPVEPQTFTLDLTGENGEPAGQLRVSLLFKPKWISRKTQVEGGIFSGTFAPAGKIVRGVGSMPMKGVGVASSGVKMITHLFTGNKKEKAIDPDTGEEVDTGKEISAAPIGEESSVMEDHSVMSHNGNNSLVPPTPPSGRMRSNSGTSATTANTSRTGGRTEYQTVGIVIMTATGFPKDETVQARVYADSGHSKLREIHKTKGVKASAGQPKFDDAFVSNKVPSGGNLVFRVYNHHTLGRDERLGEGTVKVSD
ncbi:hypothetical protein CANCADRAFT_13024, partial [Tortispora caseinolytica NRRL Y-17796]